MKTALIAWGGWEGHEPAEGAARVGAMLAEDGFEVRTVEGTAAFADPHLGELEPDRADHHDGRRSARTSSADLLAAVRGGVGLGGYHGGMGDAFRNEPEYQFMVGGQWVAHPGNVIDYRIDVVRPDDPVMAGIAQLRLPLGAVLPARRSARRGSGDDAVLRGSMPTGSTARWCRRCGRPATAGAGCSTQRARPRGPRVRRAADGDDPAARVELGGRLSSADAASGDRSTRRRTRFQSSGPTTPLRSMKQP